MRFPTHTQRKGMMYMRKLAGFTSVDTKRTTNREQTGHLGLREIEGNALQRRDCPPPLHSTFTSAVCSCCLLPRQWWKIGAASRRPVGGLIAGGWWGICCLPATNCCWNMIKCPLPANTWRHHGFFLPQKVSISLLLHFFQYLPALFFCCKCHSVSDCCSTSYKLIYFSDCTH